MAKRNEEMIGVTLNRKRPYRAKDSDRDAVWVGPGAAMVPRWVAEKWGMVETLPAAPPTGFEVNPETGGLRIASADASNFRVQPPAIPEQLPDDAVSGTVETVETIVEDGAPSTADLLPGDVVTATVETVEPFVEPEAATEVAAVAEPEAEKPRNKGGRRKGA